MSAPQFAEWYARRTGAGVPAAVRLLLAPKVSRVPPLEATRIVVLNVAELPSSSTEWSSIRPRVPCWATRLGPTAVTIADDQLGPFRKLSRDWGSTWRLT